MVLIIALLVAFFSLCFDLERLGGIDSKHLSGEILLVVLFPW